MARPAPTQATAVAREAGRRAGKAEAAEVAQLLVSAGRADLIHECVGMSVAEVRKLLDAPSHAEPRADDPMRRALGSVDPDQLWDAAFAKVRASGVRPG
jgi:hypothetical protein